jgi:hypothetical protein
LPNAADAAIRRNETRLATIGLQYRIIGSPSTRSGRYREMSPL